MTPNSATRPARIPARAAGKRPPLSAVAALLAAALAFAATGASALPTQTLTWTGAVNSDMTNVSNWSPPGFPFAADIIFDGSVSNANAEWRPITPTMQNPGFGPDLPVNSIRMINGYSGTFSIIATEQVRDFTMGAERQVDSARVIVTQDLTIDSGTLVIQDSNFAPSTTAGEITTNGSLSVTGNPMNGTGGNIFFNGGNIVIRHIRSDCRIQNAGAVLSAPSGSFNWTGGTLTFDSQEATAARNARLEVGRDWNQSTSAFNPLVGSFGLVALVGQPGMGPTSQAINSSAAFAGIATFPALQIGQLDVTIAGNSDIRCQGYLTTSCTPEGTQIPPEEYTVGTSLFVGSSRLELLSRDSTTSIAGGVSVGPLATSALVLGQNRKISAGGGLTLSGGVVDADNGNNDLFFTGQFIASSDSIVFPPANLLVSGSSDLRFGGWRVTEPENGPSEFNANLSGVASLNIGGNNVDANFLNLGDTNVQFPATINLRPPWFEETAADWVANEEFDDLSAVSIRSPLRFLGDGELRYRNPPDGLNFPALDMRIDNLAVITDVFQTPARLEILDGRNMFADGPYEIYNTGIISLLDGSRLLRDTLSLRFTDRDGNTKSVYWIGEDRVYGTIQDSDKNLNGYNSRETLPLVTFRLFSGGNLVEMEEFNQSSGSRRRFRETDIANYTFRNADNGLKLELRDKTHPSISNNGELRAIGGDSLSMTYIDPNGSGGPTEVVIVIPNPDPPPIEGPENMLPELGFSDFGVYGDVNNATYAATIRNGGLSASGPFTVGVYYNRQSPPLVSGTPDATFTVAAGLNPGASQDIEFQRPNPPEGMFEAWFVVDVGNGVAESNETNNVAGPEPYLIDQAAFIDLAITSFTATAAGAGTTYRATVENLGTANSIPCELAISYDNDAFVNAIANIPRLLPGRTRTFTVFRSGAPVGDHTASARADANNLNVESDEGNNFAVSNLHTNTDPSTTASNSMTFSSSRVGNVPITVSEADINGLTDGNTQFKRKFPTSTTSVDISAPSVFGGRSFVRWYNPANNTTFSEEESTTVTVVAGRNVRAEYGAAAPGSPDLSVDEFSAAAAGADIIFQIAVRNIGELDSGPATLALYYNRAGVASPAAGDMTIAIPALPAGEPDGTNNLFEHTFTLTSAPGGTYSPEAFADSAEVIAESNETNNRSDLTSGNSDFEFNGPGAAPDLTIMSFMAAAQGQGTRYDVVVRNAGNAGAGACLLALDYDGAGGADDTMNVGALGSGATQSFRFVRSNAPPASYTATVTVDSANAVAESNESNNTASSNKHTNTPVGENDGKRVSFTAARADLVPVVLDEIDLFGLADGVTTFSRQFPDSTTQVFASVPATHNGVGFERWVNATTGAQLATTPGATLPISAGASLRAEYAQPNPPLPDLTFSTMTASANGTDLTLTAVVENVGNADAGSCVLQFQYTPGTGEAIVVFDPISAGQFRQVQFTFNNVAAGAYTPMATIDVFAAVAESSETNNTTSVTDGNGVVTVGGGPGAQPDLIIPVFEADAMGQGTTYDVVVQNQGTSASGACVLGISYDGMSGASLTADVPALLPTQTAVFKLYRMNAVPGAYTALAAVDLNGVVAESNELNNVALSSPHQNTPVGPYDGSIVTFTTARVDSAPVTLTQADLFGFNSGVTTFTRQFGETIQSVVASVPASHGGSAFERWYDAVNQVEISTSPTAMVPIFPGAVLRAEYAQPNPPRPDLVVDMFTAVAQGDDLNFVVRAANLGNLASIPCSLAIYYQREGAMSPASGDQTIVIGALDPGATTEVTFSYMNAVPDVYEPIAFVDASLEVLESAETNNTSRLTSGNGVVTVVPTGSRRVTFTAARVEDVPVTLDTIDLTGQSSANTLFTRLFGPQVPGTVTVSVPAVHNGRNFVRWVDVGAQTEVSNTPTAIVAIADGKVYRANYEQPPVPAPDLVVERFQAELLGQGVYFEYEAVNIGNAAAGASQLALFFDSPVPPVSGMGSNLTAAIPALAAGERFSGSFVWIDTPPGSYAPWLFIDSNFEVAESSEDNNAAGLDTGTFLNGNGGGPDGGNGGNGDGDGDDNGAGGGTSGGGGGGITIGDGGGDAGGGGDDGGNGGGGATGSRIVTFTSARAENVPVLVDRLDQTGRSGGDTAFVRAYLSAVGDLTAIAPSQHDGNNFVRWFDATNGVELTTSATLFYTPVADLTTLRAEYDGAGSPLGGGNGGGPDLVVDSVVAAENGPDAMIAVTVRNAGGAAAAASTVGLYENQPDLPQIGVGFPDQTLPVPALNAGETAVVMFTLTNVQPRGIKFAWAYVDFLQQVAESAEGNNADGPARYYIWDPQTGLVAR